MQEKHFTLLTTQEGITLLQGDFAGIKNCIVGVTTLESKDIVSTITVAFPARVTWSALEEDYNTLKEMLTEKYGQPEKSVEEFRNGTPRNDKEKINAVVDNRCNYNTLFTTDNGSIELLIRYEEWHCCVVLVYRDHINCDVVRAAAMEDL